MFQSLPDEFTSTARDLTDLLLVLPRLDSRAQHPRLHKHETHLNLNFHAFMQTRMPWVGISQLGTVTAYWNDS